MTFMQSFFRLLDMFLIFLIIFIYSYMQKKQQQFNDIILIQKFEDF
jgi:hypothetical protein